MDDIDGRMLRRTFEIARSARDAGNRPFGALLAGPAPDRQVLAEAHDTVLAENDPLGHADFNVLRAIRHGFAPDFLRRCTLYTSVEPCAMCASAMFWCGVARVVFGLSVVRLLELIGKPMDVPHLAIPCRGVLAGARPHFEVTGPVFQTEAAEAHYGYWRRGTYSPRSPKSV